MQEFYKKALIAFVSLAGVSLLVGYWCVSLSHLRLPLLPAQDSSMPWRGEGSSDALDGGGNSAIQIVDATSRLRFRFILTKTAVHPYATAALVFQDKNGKPVLVDLSRYTSISLNAKCAPANTLMLGIPTFDPNVTKPDKLVSFRTPSAFFSCDEDGAHTELDLTRLETAQWWFDMFKLNLSRQAYKLDKVPRIAFSSTFQSPSFVDSTVELSEITLKGREFSYLYSLAMFLIISWGAYCLWFFRRHALALISDVKDKLQRDLPLVAYQQLSLEPHRDKEKAAILRFIATSYAKPDLDLDAVMTETGANRNKINDILKAELGFTFSAYLNKLRLTEAARLLAETNTASVAEIAYSVGYANVSYFNKLFKEEYGCTPKAFRTLSGK
ncbi:helix-turn-helix domain-containing protein [Pseudoduganella namucuonensis]|uniref:AraC-type DNA-binding protein n=1 Tax=Pseudoduganella namucuonensis TaxID=1035707 RepID=A0A1I7M3R2_9BURK|nr:AraC family transcriptional regulator [Pseudoduganella namucuonensis]SFV16555.1 AraC-type DNA-binding protein [Pseudoduganella namucuonensis]